MILNLICKYKKCRLKLFQTALLLITLYNLLLISFTAFTKASESEGSKEERSAWTISEHTAPLPYSDMRYGGRVSTHSYPKTAGHLTCFLSERKYMFQHTAARRRLDDNVFPEYHQRRVSTHSRLKAAGNGIPLNLSKFSVSTHSRLKAAGTSPPA